MATIYVYYYTFGKVDEKTHLRIGYLYALAAWISMIIITGILAFMLTPGKWLETGRFFDGFFNSTYWPQLFARTFLMFGIAAVYALIVATTLQNKAVQYKITRLAGLWGILGFLVGGLMTYWYLQKLPEPAQDFLFGGTLPYLKTLLYVSVVSWTLVLLYFLLCGALFPRANTLAGSLLLMLILFFGISAGEGLREGLRRPYIVKLFYV